VGAARTAPAVDTGGALVADETSVNEMPTEVVPDADAVEVLTPDEGGTSGGPLTGGPLAGGVAIESTELAGGVGGDAS
jgi:hypothetical protein